MSSGKEIHAKAGIGAARIPVQFRSRLCTIQFSFRDSASVIGCFPLLGTNALGRGASKLEGWLPSNTGWLERCSPLLPWYGTCIQGILLRPCQPVSPVTAKLLLPGLRYSRVLACWCFNLDGRLDWTGCTCSNEALSNPSHGLHANHVRSRLMVETWHLLK